VHTSIASGLARSVTLAEAKGCDCFQIFARNPRGWTARLLEKREVAEFRDAREKSGLWPLAIHAVYLINLAATDPLILERSREAFRDELRRAVKLGADYLVVHPGSGGGASPERAIATAVDSIKQAARGLKLRGANRGGNENGLTILIENTAGQGSSIGSAFEQVAEVLASLDDLPSGVCLDTAHTFAAGYDIATEQGFKKTVGEIGRTFGADRINLIHCNDSKAPLGARVDRHEHIGLGYLGEATFSRLTQYLKFRRVPFILETPIDKRHDDEWNLSKIRELSGL
jgi:deoxyribonuclease-4